MESKVKEYQELYEQFEELDKQKSNSEESIRNIENEIKQYRSKQNEVDYNDSDIVISYMEKYIDDSIKKKKGQVENDVKKKMLELANPSKRVKKNFDKAVKLLSMKKVDKYLRKADMDLDQDICIERAEKAMGFNALTILNTICSFVFRFDFLRFLRKVYRIIAGIVFWAIFLIPMLIARTYNKFQIIYDNELADLSAQEYDLVKDWLTKKFLGECISSIIIAAIIIVAINIIIYIIATCLAKKFLKDNKAVCLSFDNEKELKQKMYDHSVKKYMEDTVSVWKAEIKSIKNNGLSDNPRSDSLIALVKNDLHEKYDEIEEKINACRARIEEMREKIQILENRLQEIVEKLKDKEEEVNSLIVDKEHNSAVLSPYVFAGYSQHSIRGVKELIYFEHNYKPMLICYGEDTAKDGERFRKNAARLIELLMYGFYQENCDGYINMWLVDYEGLYFPKSRTSKFMKVIHTQQEAQQLFDELKTTRDTVESLDDGRIRNINPLKLARRENPIKYNIVYFVGYDFAVIDREITQLFIGGENFGFLPIVFMKKSLAQSLLKEDGSSKAFVRVLEKMNGNKQVYEFEGLVSEFEYELMVSNQKRLLDENKKLCVKKILSMDEFFDIARSDEGMDKDKVLYLDTYQLDKEIYDAVSDMDNVRLFTINGDKPEFVTKEVIKLPEFATK